VRLSKTALATCYSPNPLAALFLVTPYFMTLGDRSQRRRYSHQCGHPGRLSFSSIRRGVVLCTSRESAVWSFCSLLVLRCSFVVFPPYLFLAGMASSFGRHAWILVDWGFGSGLVSACSERFARAMLISIELPHHLGLCSMMCFMCIVWLNRLE